MDYSKFNIGQLERAANSKTGSYFVTEWFTIHIVCGPLAFLLIMFFLPFYLMMGIFGFFVPIILMAISLFVVRPAWQRQACISILEGNRNDI